ncbi:MAG: response regulator transcription factor [Acidimicrobiaceae bacterium]|jgi:DNA-binding NarL/FixJ family response regulator|nr:response regulator transcription factor [Acidimicrobiaceae bacterium]
MPYDGLCLDTNRTTVVTVLVVDDHATFAEALRHVLSAEDDIEVVAIATEVGEAERAAQATRPDVALVDHRIGLDDGVELVRALQRCVPATKLVMLTATDDDTTVLEALEAGCAGYLLKDSPLEVVVAAVRSAARGDAVIHPALLARLLPRFREREQSAPRAGLLTDRELAVLRLLAGGRPNAAIASELLISVNTVRNHVQNILTKLGAHSKLEAVAKARDSGLLGPLARS